MSGVPPTQTQGTRGGLMQDIRRGILQLLLPNTCWVCERHLPDEARSFCASCLYALTFDPFPTCPRCAGSVGPHASLEGGCTACRSDAFAFDGVFRVGVHEDLLREVVIKLKQRGAEEFAEAMAVLFAEVLAAKLKSFLPDVVIPVPLHWLRYWQRGFNQSEILGRALAENLGKPCRSRVLRRVRRTPSQKAQTAAKRRENMKGAFAARPDPSIKGKVCLLVDDVLTSGATAHEAARALRTLEPARIIVCVIARPGTR